MTTSLPRSPRSLVITTVVLAVAGVVILALPHHTTMHQAASTPPPKAAAIASPPTLGGPAPEAARQDTDAAGALARPTGASELPPHGEGPVGDAAIQNTLEAAWPADLPPDDERQLLVDR